MSRAFKNKKFISKQIKNIQKAKKNFESILIFLAVLIVCIHILACIWYIIGEVENNEDNWIFHYGMEQCSIGELYLISIYYVTTALTSIGFDDITATTIYERVFSIVLMFGGIITYSFIVSSLTNLISSLNKKNINLKQWMTQLQKIKKKHNLNFEFYLKLKNAVVYEDSKNTIDKINFLKLLPANLRLQISYIMYKDISETFSFFKGKSKRFIANIGPNLKPQKIYANDYIFLEDDNIDDIFFLKTGVVSLVLPHYRNTPFLVIEKGTYFGDVDVFSYQSRIPKRMFTARADTDCELLVISVKDFYKACVGHENYIEEIVKLGEQRFAKIQELKEKAIEEMQVKKSDIHEDPQSVKKANAKIGNESKNKMLYIKKDTLSHIDGNCFLKFMEDKNFEDAKEGEVETEAKPIEVNPNTLKFINALNKIQYSPKKTITKWKTIEDLSDISSNESSPKSKKASKQENISYILNELNTIESKLKDLFKQNEDMGKQQESMGEQYPPEIIINNPNEGE